MESTFRAMPADSSPLLAESCAAQPVLVPSGRLPEVQTCVQIQGPPRQRRLLLRAARTFCLTSLAATGSFCAVAMVQTVLPAAPSQELSAAPPERLRHEGRQFMAESEEPAPPLLTSESAPATASPQSATQPHGNYTCPPNAQVWHTGCVCDAGFVGLLSPRNSNGQVTGSCTAAKCPEHSTGENVISGCVCVPGFGGQIVPSDTLWRYDGECTKRIACPEHTQGEDVPSGCHCVPGYWGWISPAGPPTWYSGFCLWWGYFFLGVIAFCVLLACLEVLLHVLHF